MVATTNTQENDYCDDDNNNLSDGHKATGPPFPGTLPLRLHLNQ
jgi:hypothetical protein